MKFFAISALVTLASATQYYGGARLATTGLTTGYATGYNTLAAPAYSLNTVAVPAVQKVVAQPTLAVQRVGLAATGLATGYTGLGYSNLGYAGGYTYGSAAHAPLAVQSQHNVQFYDVPSGGNISPISVEVDANPIPINMIFRSASSQLNVQQAHAGAQGSVQESASEDETHVLRHSVTKPVIQEVKEVITPFRRIQQEIQPVQEEIQTLVARGNNRAVLTGVNQVLAAPAIQTIAAPAYSTFNTVQKVVAAPAIQTIAAPAYQTIAAPAYSTFNTVQKVVAAPLLQKTYNTVGGVSTLKEY